MNQDEKVIKEETKIKGAIKKERAKTQKTVYQTLRINGNIQYAKFNKDHNEKILRALKEESYFSSVDLEDIKVYKE